MSTGLAKKAIQVKYKKISFKDLEFDQGDDFFERGQFGDVKRARWNEKVVAVKCFTSADRKGGFSEELVCLSLLQSHEHIVEMHGACVSEHPFIVLEFAPMSLEKVLHDKGKKQYRYHVEHVMSWSRQIALALEYIHSKDMLHRDVKPSNVLLFKDGLLLKLCDFGTAKKLEHTLTNAVGTIRYMAPEVIRGRNYGESCDVFSFGVVFWEMITRRRSTLGAGKGQHSNMAILYAMANGQKPPKISNIPKALSDMISKCWDNEQQNRPSMNEIRVKLEKLCEYVDEAKPLVSKRLPKQKKEEPSQGDMFADSRHSTQHENPDYKKETEGKDGSSSGAGEVGRRDKQSDVTSPSKSTDSPPELPPRDNVSDPFRDRCATAPTPTRPINIGGPSEGGTPPIADYPASPQQRQSYKKQISTPHPSSAPQLHHSITFPPQDQFYGSPAGPGGSDAARHYPLFSPAERQISEYGNFSSEMSYGTENILKRQSERFANYELETMKKKQASPRFPSLLETSSPYYIPGLESDLQPCIPIEDSVESKELYRQYRTVADQVMRAKKEYESLLEESTNLDKELKYDRQKLEANRGLTQQHHQLLQQKDMLVAELQEHQEKLNKLMAKADQSKKLFQEAMQSGYVVLHTIVLLLIGVAGAGKTCFCHMLFDEPPPSLRASTPLAKSSIRANSSVRDKGLSFERAALSHRKGAVFWERISVEMFNGIIAEGIKSIEGVKTFEPVTNPGAIAEYLPVLLPASEDLQLRVVPPIEHTISAHETYGEMDWTDTAMEHYVSHHVEAVAVSHPQSSDIDQLFEMESVKQLLGMISQSKGSVELLRREWLYIIDSGGQPQFHELLPTFVRHVSAVAFFVKLNETLATRPMIEYYSKGGCLGEPYQSSQTNLQILQNCLQAMQARCLVDNTAKCPELFFIGTHYDLETKKEPLSDKNAQLFAILHQHDIFRKHLAYNSLGSVDQLLYPVNAQMPSAADKQVVASFRQDIIEKCQKHERQIPIRWFVLESLLQELSQHGIISFKKCLEVAGRLGMDEDRLRAAIEYLAQLNMFEFYPSVLPKVVFTTSQVLLTKVTELVEYSHLLRNRSVAHCSSDDKEFRDNGYLNVKFLEHKRFSSHFVSGLFEVKDLLALLEDRLVITKRGSDKLNFVMMAVLSELPPDKLEEHRLAISKSSTHIPIAVHYPGSLFPAGIFTSLVSHLQTSSKWTIFMNELTAKPECLFKNCVDFMIDTDELNAFTTLIYTHQWIELYVQIDGDQQQVYSLKRMLFNGLKHAAEVQKYSSITPELAFLCPHDYEQEALSQAVESPASPSQPPHLATVTRNKQRIRCKLNKRISYELKEKYAVWIASDELFIATESNTTPDYEKPRPTSVNLTLITWRNERGEEKKFRLKQSIMHKWRDVGDLVVPRQQLEVWANEKDAKACCTAVLSHWLDHPPRHYPATWEGLYKLLNDSEFGEVATELKQAVDNAVRE